MGEQIEAFLNSNKSLLVAPAGYGKTTFLANCLSTLLPIVSKRILILTHTHAGVASIKNKCSEIKSKGLVEITTISGFTQKLVSSFNGGLPAPTKDGRPNFQKINEEAIIISNLKLVQKILGNTFSHIFVDEYQDCSTKQHIILINFARYIPLHTLADPLQAIFRFNNNDGILNFDTDFSDFEIFDFLQTPWRWYQEGNNKLLGNTTKFLRKSLIASEDIRLDKLYGVEFIKTSSNLDDFYQNLHRIIQDLKSRSLLVLYPNGFEYSIEARATNRVRFDFSREFTLIEAIDDKTFYVVAQLIDNFIKSSVTKTFTQILKEILIKSSFNKGDIQKWFNDKGVKQKRQDDAAKEQSAELKSLYETLYIDRTEYRLYKFISYLRYNLRFSPKRPELLYSIKSILKMHSNDTISERMAQNRNKVRIVGRKVDGKCIGTTLLTKGLEFEDVIVIDAHKIEDKEDFYVAMTRASKRLIIMSESQKWPATD